MPMWDPSSIVFGLRHKNRFSFLDYAGEILDSVIEMQEAGELPRGVNFDEVGWQKTMARLHDTKGAVIVDFNVDGIVLTVDPNRSQLDRESSRRLFVALARKVLPLSGGDDRVNRIGTLESYRFDHEPSGAVAAATLMNLGSLGTATDVAMRVSFRSATDQSLVREVGDWRNTIIQVWNRRSEQADPDPKHLDVSIDYQSYFVPEKRYGAALVEEHYRSFLDRLETLHSGQLAALAGEQVAR